MFLHKGKFYHFVKVIVFSILVSLSYHVSLGAGPQKSFMKITCLQCRKMSFHKIGEIEGVQHEGKFLLLLPPYGREQKGQLSPQRRRPCLCKLLEYEWEALTVDLFSKLYNVLLRHYSVCIFIFFFIVRFVF